MLPVESGRQTRFQLVKQMAKECHCSILRTARSLEVSASGYYAHQHKDKKPRRQQDVELTAKITAFFLSSRKTYGSPRMAADLRENGFFVGKNRITRLMRQAGLKPRQKRKFRPTTTQSDPTHQSRITENWWAKFPTPDKLNHVWVADITYIPTEEGWLYLAGNMDVCSRKIVGHSTSDDLSTPLVTAAWNQSLRNRRPDPGLLNHTDRGCQYTSHDYQNLLKNSHASSSMSRKGNCYDNAHQESFWATLKAECFGDYIAKTKQEAKLMIFDYIHCFYNPKRRHSSLGMLSPDQFEKYLLNPNLNN